MVNVLWYERLVAPPDGSNIAKLSGNVLGATCHGAHALAYLNNHVRRSVRPVGAFSAHMGSGLCPENATDAMLGALVPPNRRRRPSLGVASFGSKV